MMFQRLLIVVLVVSIFATALAVINAKHQNRRAFSELQALLKQRDEMEINWGRLQLEQGAWATHGRVEQLARKELEMTIPPSRSVVIVKP